MIFMLVVTSCLMCLQRHCCKHVKQLRVATAGANHFQPIHFLISTITLVVLWGHYLATVHGPYCECIVWLYLVTLSAEYDWMWHKLYLYVGYQLKKFWANFLQIVSKNFGFVAIDFCNHLSKFLNIWQT